MQRKLLFLSLFFLLLVGALHMLGSYFYFYWDLWWFDNLVHFLGGLGLGICLAWFLFYSGLVWKTLPRKSQIFFTTLIGMIIIGGIWEIFEYANGLTQSTEGYASDTFHDLLADTLGGAVAGWITTRKPFYE